MKVGNLLANSNTRTHGDIVTLSGKFGAFSDISVEAGTNGEQGGDYGHGSRSYIRLSGLSEGGGTFVSQVLVDSNGNVDGIEIDFGGDDELDAMIDALNFIIETFKLMNSEVNDARKCY